MAVALLPYLQQAYLLNSRFLLHLGDLAEMVPHTKFTGCWFQLRQLADAIRPTNFPATNPEVHRARGRNRWRKPGGEECTTARGAMSLAGASMTDEQAFEVGRNLAITPGAVVYENEVIQLIQYSRRNAEGAREVPC